MLCCRRYTPALKFCLACMCVSRFGSACPAIFAPSARAGGHGVVGTTQGVCEQANAEVQAAWCLQPGLWPAADECRLRLPLAKGLCLRSKSAKLYVLRPE